MIVRTLDELEATDRCVRDENWVSRRLLLQSDQMGFSMHDTILHAGTTTPMWYRNHVEAVYCIEGEGEIVDIEAGTTHPISKGTIYALDKNDKHILRATTQLRMICVFNPPLLGQETHDADGAYPILEPQPSLEGKG
ncbi:MAG: L-ectoine synthase [Planctomycetota bacterium]|jgi:L-ectoine synthase